VILVAREDSRTVIVDPPFTAFRSMSGDWTAKPPGGSLSVELLEDEFIDVKDSAIADNLRAETESALSDNPAASG